jgi:hypothetical protein
MPTARIAAAFVFLALMPALAAQTTAPGRPASASGAQTQTGQTPAPVPTSDLDARTTREQFRELMQRFPPDLGRVLKLDPTLLRSESYLAQYPALATFLTVHPEIAHNPAYFLDFVPDGYQEWQPLDARGQTVRLYRDIFESFGAFAIFVTVAGLIAWFVRMFIDYRRWLRLSKVQTEVHNKLLERFAGTGDLLAYVQSPAGRRFLESAPIPLDAGPRQVAAPFGRILWAVQAGVVITIVGLGFQIVSGRVIEDIGQPLALIGVLGMALGIGFILSGGVSYLLARKMGLMEPVVSPAVERHDSSPA